MHLADLIPKTFSYIDKPWSNVGFALVETKVLHEMPLAFITERNTAVGPVKVVPGRVRVEFFCAVISAA